MNRIDVDAARALRPGAPVHRALSEQLWGIDWRLPFHFDDVSVTMGTFAEAAPFIAENYHRIFGEEDAGERFIREPMTTAKERYAELSDVFVFRADGRIVGLTIAHPTDWSSYYLRSTAFLAEYRNRRLLSRFLDELAPPLTAAGVGRLEADVSPTNVPVQRALLGAGFVFTGTTNSERWGAVLRITKFLKDDESGAFRRQFCVTPR